MFHLTISSIVYLVSIFLNLFLGFWVYLQGRKKIVNKTFFLFILSIVGWLFTLFLFYTISNPKWVLLIGRLNFAIVVMMLFFGLEFAFLFPKKIFVLKKWKQNLVAAETVLLFLLTLFTPLIDKNEIILNTSRETVYGPLYFLFIIHFVAFVVAIIGVFIKKLQKFSGIAKTQIYYVIWGLTFTAIFGFVTNILIPLIGYQDIANLGPLTTFFLVGTFSYAIVKYRLMDIRVVMGRTAIYVFSFATVIAFGFLLIYLNNQLSIPVSFNIIGPLILVLCIFFFQLFFKIYEKLASRYFYYTFYSYQKVLTDLGKELTQILDLNRLANLIVKTLVETMKLDRTVVLLREEKGDYTILKNIGFREENGISLVKDNFLTQYLAKTKTPLIYEELSLIQKDAPDKEKEDLEKLKQNMKRIEAELCLPLFQKEKIIGIIVLGKKVSGDAYSKEDLELLITLSAQTSISLQNASRYYQVQDLSQNLQEKVAEQTKELQKAYEELKKIDKAKSEFISMASHQLRTPLSSIKGYISMILEGDYGKIGKRAKEKLKNVFHSNERLIKIVNDLLDISKIELGKMELKKSPCQIEELLESCYQEMKPEIERKNLEFIFKKPEVSLPKIEIDELKIRQVVLNLIDNAIRYTRQGQIELCLQKKPNSILIFIKDTGEGLTKEEQKEIFEGFTRGSAGIDFFIEGAGLGLYVAKKYLDLHNGKIWAESKGKGEGSVFYVELPIK